MSKPNTDILTHTVCFSCGMISPIKRGDHIKCPSCGFAIDTKTYQRIMTYAITVVYHGYDYRKAYEAQLAKNGAITKHYALPDPSTLLCFCGAAALSGVIGGIAYDCVKKVIRTIVSRAKSIDQDIGQSKVVLDLNSDIDVFIQYIQQYCLERGTIDKRILIEIQLEELAWELTDATLISKTANYSKEQIIEVIHKAISKIREPECLVDHGLLDYDFNSFWNDLLNETDTHISP